MLALSAATIALSATAQAKGLRGWNIHVEDYPVSIGMEEFAADIAEKTEGRITAKVYQSLKTGVVDGAENNPPSYESTNHFEVAKFYSITEHLIIPECLCMSKKTWDSFSPEDQEIVMAAGRASADTQRKLWQDREAVSMEAVVAGGTTVNQIEDKAPFQAAMAPVYDQFLKDNPDLSDLVSMIRDAD